MTNRQITLRFLSEPTDINYGGKVHGGIVMKWIDEAAYACASQWCATYCVTVYVAGIRFYAPIHIGHLVEVEAELIYTGTSSMHIAINVFSRSPSSVERVKNTHCVVVFVGLDDDGSPRSVPHWEPQTPQEKSQEEYARRLLALGKELENEMLLHARELENPRKSP